MTMKLGAAPSLGQAQRRQRKTPGVRISLRSLRPTVTARTPKVTRTA